MAYIPKVRFGFKPFYKTDTYAEQLTYRKVATYGGENIFTPNARAVLQKIVNLWIRHRRKGWMAFTVEYLCDALWIGRRSCQMALAQLRELGFLVYLSGGNGRGDVPKYAFDLARMMRVLAPNMAMKIAGEWVNQDGELKGANLSSLYKETKTFLTPILINLPRSLSFDRLGNLFRRFATNERAWFLGHRVTPPWQQLATSGQFMQNGGF